MEHILLLTDFSEDALHAARYAIELFGKDQVSYSAVHAHMDMPMGDPLMPTSSMAPELASIAESGLREWSERLHKETGVHALKDRFFIGSTVNAVKELGRAPGADLVVVGRSGKGGSAFFGSTAVDLMKRSRVPVLVVPRSAALASPGTILLADDHDEVDPHDLTMLRTIAARTGAKVIVAHVEMEVAEGSAHWSNGIYGLGLKGIEHTFMSAHGTDVADGLDRLARRKHAGMVAVLHRHLDLISRLLHPSITKDLVLHGDRPTLVLVEGEER